MAEQRKKLIFIVVLAILIVIGSFYSFGEKNSVSENVSSGEALAKSATTKDEMTSEIVVYISGAVNRPGVFTATNKSRVVDIVKMAGGLSPDADATKINMAQSVKDGMHINVGAKALVNGDTGTAAVAKVKSGNMININTASKSELDTLPGVGPALAERIMEYRQANGSFNDIGELRKVPGIGQSKFEKMKDKITI